MIVVGAGLVGLALAAACADAGLDVTLVGAEAPPEPPPGWDSRIYAISPGSVEWLGRLDIWSRLPAERIQAVHRMDVSGDRGGAGIRFDALEAGVPALAWIVESGAIARAAWSRAAECGRIRTRVPARPVALSISAQSARVTFDAGSALTARLVVGADGARSWVRETGGFVSHLRDYPQHAVVANFDCADPHGAVARQWFRDDGVLALLPLPGKRVSMVWSAPPAVAEALLAMPADALAQHVAEASGGSVGDLACITPAAVFPLRALECERLALPRLALVGDAAHNVHPLAGQGVNLGFRDVRVLADVLRGRGAEQDCGVLPLLRRYERARREDIRSMLAVTDALQRLFSSRVPGVAWLRNTGLDLAARLPMIRTTLARHALA